jgi:bacteriorhodopsin
MLDWYPFDWIVFGFCAVMALGQAVVWGISAPKKPEGERWAYAFIIMLTGLQVAAMAGFAAAAF